MQSFNQLFLADNSMKTVHCVELLRRIQASFAYAGGWTSMEAPLLAQLI